MHTHTHTHTHTHAQGSDELCLVEVGHSILIRLHRSEVIVKKWGVPIGNQYYRSVMTDFPISQCNNCNKVRYQYTHNLITYYETGLISL